MRTSLVSCRSLTAALLIAASLAGGTPAAQAQWAEASAEFPPLPDQTPAVVHAAEAFLAALNDAQRSALYFVSFLGEPSATEPWMLQFGGHHLGIHATLVGPNVTLSPTLTGGQPLKVKSLPRLRNRAA